MDYEKKYKDAFERARKLQENSNGMILKKWLWNIFPELKESEDERIRKSLLEYLHTLPNHYAHSGVCVPEWITWLEKQGEQKYIPKYKIGDYVKNTNYKGEPIYEIVYMDKECYICEYRGNESMGDKTVMHFSFDNPYLRLVQKPTDKVEPNFNVGEWITDGDYTWKIVEVKPLDYILQSQDGNIVDDTISHVDEHFHSFTIEDTKNSDVLSDGTTIFIFKDLLSDGSVMSYCDYDTDSGESDAFCPLSVNLMCSKITPATKEQCDSLFQKMKEAGYEWDSEKKELKKIEENSFECDRVEKAMHKAGYEWSEETHQLKKIEQKFSWSEEDERIYQSIIDDTVQENQLDSKQIDWLKSLKERI